MGEVGNCWHEMCYKVPKADVINRGYTTTISGNNNKVIIIRDVNVDNIYIQFYIQPGSATAGNSGMMGSG